MAIRSAYSHERVDAFSGDSRFEGGLDRNFGLIRKAYQISDKPDNFTYYHYKKFADPTNRKQIEQVSEGIDRDTYLNLINVDPENHYFKEERVLPWIDKVLK